MAKKSSASGGVAPRPPVGTLPLHPDRGAKSGPSSPCGLFRETQISSFDKISEFFRFVTSAMIRHLFTYPAHLKLMMAWTIEKKIIHTIFDAFQACI